MPHFSLRLAQLTARDVMTERLIVLQATDTVLDAATTLRDHQISGAPVVDEQGRPIGVFSPADVVPAVASRLGSVLADSGDRDLEQVCDLLSSSQTRLAAGGDEVVTGWMSRRIGSVVETTPLVEVARTMCDRHAHRVVVVDAAGKLRGIVSAMDVLAAIVKAADESRTQPQDEQERRR